MDFHGHFQGITLYEILSIFYKICTTYFLLQVIFILYKKVKVSSPVTGPEGSRKLKFPDFVTMAQDGDRLSALPTGRLYPPGNTPGAHFC